MKQRLYLLYFDKLYDKFTDAEKKEFLSSFVERVDIYEDELPNGRFLRHIKFKFPVFYNGQEIDEMSWDKESTVETVLCRNCFLFAVSPFRLWQATLPGAVPFVLLLDTLISPPASPEKVSVGRSFSFASSEIPPLTLQQTFFRCLSPIRICKISTA